MDMRVAMVSDTVTVMGLVAVIVAVVVSVTTRGMAAHRALMGGVHNWHMC